MKKINHTILSCLAGLILFSFQDVIAQDATFKKKPLEVTKQKTNDMSEAELRKQMKADGVSDPVIDKFIAQRKLWMLSGRNVNWTSVKNANPSAAQAPCNGLGVEGGWGSWLGDTGVASTGSQAWTGTPVLPTAPHFSITAGTGIDPNTPSAGNKPIPYVCPGFGSSSIQIGETCQPLYGTEQLTYPINVTPSDTNFVFAYAVVIQDAGHSVSQQPFVELGIYDAAGNPIPCGSFRYTGGPNIPGFYPVSGLGCASTFGSQYKPWTIVGINLSAYIGQVINVVITNVDCAQGGHWAYSYWDFMCGTTGMLSAGCYGSQSTISGPIDPNIQYTYQWYQNGVLMPAPAGTQPSIYVTPQIGDTFTVEVQQPSGCNFVFGYVPAVVLPGFTSTGNCGTFTFTDTSMVTPSSAVATAWNWSFPGGTPSSATTQTAPPVTYTAPGSYVVTLTVTISAGCTAIATQTINVTALPTAFFTTSPACLGSAVTLTDGSVSPAGDPIVSWDWSMPTATPSTATGTSVSMTYAASGAYAVTLTVTTQSGCPSIITQQVIVYNPPVANFSGSGTGCVPVCVNNYTDLSTSTDGNITSWAWSFPGGLPPTSTLATPPSVCYNIAGTYGASLVVTTTYGCTHSITITPIVTPRPWPKSEFCVVPPQASTTDPVFTFCDLWSPNPGVTNWYWNFGDGSPIDSINTDPVHSYSTTATLNDFYTYNVCLYVKNQYDCWDSICHTVEILPEFTFYIPNTFTPNNDLNNEFFFGKGWGIKDYTIWLFDRWGNLIWDCEHAGSNVAWDVPGSDGLPSYCKWDGKIKKGGIDMSGGSKRLSQEDVYVWKVKLTDVFNKKHTYVGHVNVVR